MPDTINTAKSTSFIAVLGYGDGRELTYTIQSTNLGGVTLQPAEMPARFSNIPFPGDKAQFGNLNIRFLLDENLSQWTLLNKWVFDMTNGVNQENINDLITSVEISILDRQNQPKVKIMYHNAHVIDIGDIEYDMVGDEQTLVCTATFVYTHYTINITETGETIEYGKPKSRLN